eukprot:365557-Chlamydomonas_euryale.AAC.13
MVPQYFSSAYNSSLMMPATPLVSSPLSWIAAYSCSTWWRTGTGASSGVAREESVEDFLPLELDRGLQLPHLVARISETVERMWVWSCWCWCVTTGNRYGAVRVASGLRRRRRWQLRCRCANINELDPRAKPSERWRCRRVNDQRSESTSQTIRAWEVPMGLVRGHGWPALPRIKGAATGEGMPYRLSMAGLHYHASRGHG